MEVPPWHSQCQSPERNSDDEFGISTSIFHILKNILLLCTSEIRKLGLRWWFSDEDSALPLQGVWVQSLVEEWGSHMPCGMNKKLKKKKQTQKTFSVKDWTTHTFRLCWSYAFYCSYSMLQVKGKSSPKQYIDTWAWLCSIKLYLWKQLAAGFSQWAGPWHVFVRQWVCRWPLKTPILLKLCNPHLLLVAWPHWLTSNKQKWRMPLLR